MADEKKFEARFSPFYDREPVKFAAATAEPPNVVPAKIRTISHKDVLDKALYAAQSLYDDGLLIRDTGCDDENVDRAACRIAAAMLDMKRGDFYYKCWCCVEGGDHCTHCSLRYHGGNPDPTKTIYPHTPSPEDRP